jgi:hypothetical protein
MKQRVLLNILHQNGKTIKNGLPNGRCVARGATSQSAWKNHEHFGYKTQTFN